MADKAASPNPAVSSAKNRRLDALHQRLGEKRQRPAGSPPSNKMPKAGTADATPPPGKQRPAAFPYDPLDHVRFDTALARRLQEPSVNKDAAAAFLNGLLTRAANESTGVQTIKQKVQDRVLQLDNPATVKAPKTQRQQRQHRVSTAPSVGSAAVRRARVKELSHLPLDQQRYDLYKPLNVLWKAYASKLLQSPNLEDDLLQADLHGCQLTVLDSKVQRHVGRQGIVVQDRGNVLLMITPDNQQLLLAKKGGKFRVQLDALHAMELQGSAMAAS